MLVEIDLKPGVFSESSGRAAIGRVKRANNVRWPRGWAEKLAGWQYQIAETFTGICRALCSWTSLDHARLLGLGTHSKLYVSDGSDFFNITPYRSTGTYANNPLAVTIGSAVVTVTHNSHGLIVGADIVIAGSAAIGGITPNGEFLVASVTTNTFTYVFTSPATSSVAAGGGAAVTYKYEINPGTADSFIGTGFGSGTFGSSTFGTPRTVSSITLARTWSLSPWGEDLIASPRSGAVYIWDQDSGTGTHATLITQAPSKNLRILVTPENRQIISFGSYSATFSDLDPMLITWCDNEDYTVWTAASTNNAGSKRLDHGNEIIAALITKAEIVILTDRSLYTMTATADSFVFDFKTEGDTIGAISPNCACDVNSAVYYMGRGQFMRYDGRVSVIPCDVYSRVFDNINWLQAHKIYCGRNKTRNEIYWFYCSADADEIDRWVSYNYDNGAWATGDDAMARTAWLDENTIVEEPLATGADGYLYIQETGRNAVDAALSYSLETWDLQAKPEGMGVGERIQGVQRVIPDWREDEDGNPILEGTHQLTLYGRKRPLDNLITKGPRSFTSTTKKIDIKCRARQISMKLSSDALDTHFCMGTFQVDADLLGER